MYKFRPKVIIVLLFSLYFVSGYVSEISSIEKAVIGAQFVPLGILAAGGGYLFIRSVTRKPFGLFPARLRLFYVYIAVSLVLLVTANLNALRPAYSISRVMVSVGILALSVVFFWQALRVIEQTEMRYGRLLTYSLITLLVILLLGQLTIPRWASGVGGVRMSGGSNPNQVGFFAFFAIFWAHYSALKKGEWGREKIYLYTLAFIVLVWSLSRSVILTWISLYFTYFIILSLYHLSRLLRGRMRVSLLKKVSALGIILTLVVSAVPNLKNTIRTLRDFQKIEQRISGEGGLRARMRAWEDVWPYFAEAPLTGHAGWWNSTNIISQKGGIKTATSPHNLFVRILVESGLLGFFVVTLLPLSLLLYTVLRLFFVDGNENKKEIFAFLFASITAVFVGQNFEDRYMVGLGTTGPAIVYFLVTCGLREVLKE